MVYPKAVSHLGAAVPLPEHRWYARRGPSPRPLAAAAEHGRSQDGFAKLDAIPGDLGTKLTLLFQPSSATRPLHRVLLAAVTQPVKPLRVLRAVVTARPVWFVVGLAVVLAAGIRRPGHRPRAADRRRRLVVHRHRSRSCRCPWHWPLGLLTAALGLALLADRLLPENGFGLCNGPRPGRGPPAAHRLAGDDASTTSPASRPIADHPLTLGDLWDAGQRPFPLWPTSLCSTSRDIRRRPSRYGETRTVNLEMMTTNLTTRRPHRLPSTTTSFSFCRDRNGALFPEYVVDHLVENSDERGDKPDTGDAVIDFRCPNHADQRLRSFPAAPNLPVIVLTRMSLSFPVLLSAIPLYAVDYARAKGHRRVERMWFSDGGISSNFPMHFFDALWPSWPTFGINLQPQHPDHPDQMTYRPTTAGAGILPRAIPFDSMVGFAGAIMDTMQNWADTALIKLPGYRERVVEVRQRPTEGGMNLVMDDETIRDLADRGTEAAATFDEFAFDEHRWIRHRVAMAQLSRAFTGMRGLWDAGVTPTYEQLLPVPEGYPYAESAAFRAQDEQAARKLMDLADAWEGLGSPGRTEPPHPEPDLRMTPPL